jgi:FkbM family methyltransferase
MKFLNFKSKKLPPHIRILLELQKRGYDSKVIYDIGAFKGDWSKEVKHYFPQAKCFLFEANPAYAADLMNTGLDFFNVALSEPGKSSVRFYNAGATGNSYYKENTVIFDNSSSVELSCTTLDSLIDQYKLPIPNFLKIDTQGSEIDILKGFQNLTEVDFILIECPIIQYNHGAPNIHDYLTYFKNFNFIPIEIAEIHKIDHVVLQIDILFASRIIKSDLFGAEEIIRPFAT